MSMDTEALEIVADIDIVPVALTVQALLDAYELRFIPAAAGELAQADFSVASQRSTEPLLKWHGRLRELYRRAFPQVVNWEIERQLIMQFCRGLEDVVLYNYIMDSRPQTYTEALTLGQSKQASNRLWRVTPSNKRHLNHMGGAEDQDSVEAALATLGGRASGKENAVLLCWFCGMDGHLQRECPRYTQATVEARKVTGRPRSHGAGPSQGKRGGGGGKKRGAAAGGGGGNKWTGWKKAKNNASISKLTKDEAKPEFFGDLMADGHDDIVAGLNKSENF